MWELWCRRRANCGGIHYWSPLIMKEKTLDGLGGGICVGLPLEQLVSDNRDVVQATCDRLNRRRCAYQTTEMEYLVWRRDEVEQNLVRMGAAPDQVHRRCERYGAEAV